MAVLGGYYFSAQNGTVTASAALNNPYNSRVTVDTTGFFKLDILKHVNTDTHYNIPDRRGRHVVFMARLVKDYGITGVRGIACNEHTAVCIYPDGNSRVFGDYPAYQNYAYFLQVNCSENPWPETCVQNSPFLWNRNSKTLKVYRLPGTETGQNIFDLATRERGTGGVCQDGRGIEDNSIQLTAHQWIEPRRFQFRDPQQTNFSQRFFLILLARAI